MKRFVLLANIGVAIVLVSVTAAQTLTVLHNFGDHPGDVTGPGSPGLIAQGRNGNLYSTSSNGGTSGFYGGVFGVVPTGAERVLHSFNGSDGSGVAGGLTLSTDGNFYGTTSSGGPVAGTIFKITPSGILTTLYNFTCGTDGGYPFAPPIQGTDGNFYGTTTACGSMGFGGVYRITSSGVFTAIAQFDVSFQNSYAPLVQGTDGNFYGAAANGLGFGSLFSVTPSGRLATVYTFDSTHGNGPFSALVQAPDGSFYGTTVSGGQYQGGVLFKVTQTGVLTLLHEFGASSDGSSVVAGLVQATDGKLYGATLAGGTMGFGTLYSMTRTGHYAVLYNFDSTGGSGPYVTPTLDTNGILYGDTSAGGSNNGGVFYSLNVGLNPFVRPLPTSGRVGNKVGILGQGLTGTTSVSFSGVAATFNVTSDTFLTAIVPTAATTGFVTVITPGATLRSNIQFRVVH